MDKSRELRLGQCVFLVSQQGEQLGALCFAVYAHALFLHGLPVLQRRRATSIGRCAVRGQFRRLRRLLLRCGFLRCGPNRGRHGELGRVLRLDLRLRHILRGRIEDVRHTVEETDKAAALLLDGFLGRSGRRRLIDCRLRPDGRRDCGRGRRFIDCRRALAPENGRFLDLHRRCDHGGGRLHGPDRHGRRLERGGRRSIRRGRLLLNRIIAVRIIAVEMIGIVLLWNAVLRTHTAGGRVRVCRRPALYRRRCALQRDGIGHRACHQLLGRLLGADADALGAFAGRDPRGGKEDQHRAGRGGQRRAEAEAAHAAVLLHDLAAPHARHDVLMQALGQRFILLGEDVGQVVKDSVHCVAGRARLHVFHQGLMLLAAQFAVHEPADQLLIMLARIHCFSPPFIFPDAVKSGMFPSSIKNVHNLFLARKIRDFTVPTSMERAAAISS